MVDLTTLPVIESGVQITAGQRFTIRGQGFGAWPQGLVLGFSEDYVRTRAFGGFLMMRAVSKTDEEIVFEAVTTHTYGAVTTWQFIGTPEDAPRAILSYERI